MTSSTISSPLKVSESSHQVSIEQWQETQETTPNYHFETNNAMVKKGYARKLSPNEDAEHSICLSFPSPIPKSQVFDIDAKSRGVSLNDILRKGPAKYYQLVSVLFNIHSKEICVDIMEDIKAFRLMSAKVLSNQTVDSLFRLQFQTIVIY